MSTKSTIFLTKHNEHCYYEHALHHADESGNFIGDTIVLEMSKRNVEVFTNDSEDLIVEIKPGSELYKVFDDIYRKPFYSMVKLLKDLKEWEKVNFLEDDLLKRINDLIGKAELYL